MDLGANTTPHAQTPLLSIGDSEATLNSIIAHSPIGMVLVSPDGRCLHANRAMCDMLGYSEAELLGLRSADLTHPADIAASEQVYRLLSGDGPDYHCAEKRYRKKNGDFVWAYVAWSLVRDGAGHPRKIVVQVTDITAHKQHEMQLEDLANYLGLAIQASGIGIWSYDFDTGEFQADARVWELWGRDMNDGDNSARAWISCIHPDDREKVMTRYKAALAGAGRFEAEHRILLRDGRIRHIQVQSAVQNHEDGRPRKLIGTNLDQTDRVEIARYLQRAKDEAEAANRAKSMFLANMSHELRTPLNAIIGFSDAMKSGIVNVANEHLVRSYCSDIHASGQHLLGIINDLLDLSRIEAGKFSLNETVMDPRDAIDDACIVMRNQVAEAGLVLKLDIGEPVPQLRADERALRQILLNLLSNAVKFTPPGGQITCGLRADAQVGLRLWVADTGIGIAAADLPRLMRPFAQIDNVYKRQYQGAGLGLAIVRSLMEMHGGDVSIDSTPGKGTVVRLTLPPQRLAGQDFGPGQAPSQGARRMG